MQLTEKLLMDSLERTCASDGLNWVKDQLAALSNADSIQPLEIALAMARRKMGDKELAANHALLAQWNCSDAGRVLLILCAHPDNHNVLKQLYKQGDEYEKEAILKGLALLDSGGELSDLAVDACRTNVLTMLSSIALENEYPAQFFAENAFNQLVLKCLFMGFDISRVMGLKSRQNPSMSRMCYDYLRERAAADREIPASIWLAIRIDDVDNAYETFKQNLNQDNESGRFYLVKALCDQISSREEILAVLSEHQCKENSERIQQYIARHIPGTSNV